MDEVKREIKQILIGNVIPSGKYLQVPERGIVGLRTGLGDSADMVLIFGVAKHTRYYAIEGNPNKIKAAGHRSISNIGRKVILRSNPDAEIGYCKYMVTRPIVLLFEVDDIGAKVETYTSRGIFGLISELWIRNKFMKEMPELREIDRHTLAGIYKQRAEEEKKAEEERLKAEEEEKKRLEEEKKKEEEERKKQEALEAAEELSDEDIEEIIKARAERKKKKDTEAETETETDIERERETGTETEIERKTETENSETDSEIEKSDESIADLEAIVDSEIQTEEMTVQVPDTGNPDTDSIETETHYTYPEQESRESVPENKELRAVTQKKPSLRGAKKRFQRAPKLLGDQEDSEAK